MLVPSRARLHVRVSGSPVEPPGPEAVVLQRSSGTYAMAARTLLRHRQMARHSINGRRPEGFAGRNCIPPSARTMQVKPRAERPTAVDGGRRAAQPTALGHSVIALA